MKTQLKYIELKSGYSDDGPAWIGKVEFSKPEKLFISTGMLSKVMVTAIALMLKLNRHIGFRELKRTDKTDIGREMEK